MKKTSAERDAIAIAKARAMIQAGYPLGQVLHAMQLSGIRPELLDAIAIAYKPKSKPKGIAKKVRKISKPRRAKRAADRH